MRRALSVFWAGAAGVRLVWWLILEVVAEALARETGRDGYLRVEKIAAARCDQAETDLDHRAGMAA